MDSFIFNGISSKEMKILIREPLQPVPRAEKNVNFIEIPGRNGYLVEDNQSYKPIPYSIICNTTKDIDINKLKSWLIGSGKLILSNNPKVYYDAYIANQLDIETMVRKLKVFQVYLKLQPIAHSLEKYIKSIKNTSKFDFMISDATEKMSPIITVYGDSEITLNINGTNLNVTPDESICVDCDLQIAHKDYVDANSAISGPLDEIFLFPGINKIEITGEYDEILLEYSKNYL